MGDTPVTQENKPKPKHRALIARQHARMLFMKAQGSRAATRTEERWLGAAVAELEDLAELEIKIGAVMKGKMLEKPEEIVEREFSDDAVKGIKSTLVQALLGNPSSQTPPANFADRQDFLAAAASFGAKFRAMVEKEGKLPDNEDLDEEKPLELA